MQLDSLVRSLDLQPHPEGGFYRETFRSTTEVTAPGGGPRSAVTQILYALAAGEHSAWHRVGQDELWQHQGGGPLDLFVLDGQGLRITRLGSVLDGHRPQGVVPAGAWQAARSVVPSGLPWTLCGCTVAPGFEFADFELAHAAQIAELVRAAGEEHAELVRSLGPRP